VNRGWCAQVSTGRQRDLHHASPGLPEPHRSPSTRAHVTLLCEVARSTEMPELSTNTARRQVPHTSILKTLGRQCSRRHAPLDTPLSETPADDWLGSPFTHRSRRGGLSWRPALAPIVPSARPPSPPVLRRRGSRGPDPVLRISDVKTTGADAPANARKTVIRLQGSQLLGPVWTIVVRLVQKVARVGRSRT
jgi:hypothetical protein